jgi:hypothetical protein
MVCRAKGKQQNNVSNSSRLHPLLTAIVRALVRRLALTIRRVVARKAGSAGGYWGLEGQGARQHVGVAAKTPFGVKAGRRGKEAVLYKPTREC